MATATAVIRPVVRRVDDPFFIAMSLAIALTVMLGFGPSYFYRGAVFAPLPSAVVHVHGAIFSSWVILYVVQTALVARKKIRWHRTLGTFGAVLAGLMVVMGWVVTITTVQHGRTPSIFTPAQFLVINCWGVVLFAFMVAWAIVKRRDGAAHKRLMLLATIGIMPPAITRIQLIMHWPGFAVPLWMLALCLMVIAFDVWTRRRPHYATIVGTLVTFSVPVTATLLGKTAWLQGIATRLTEHS
jgi:hypothetical protein